MLDFHLDKNVFFHQIGSTFCSLSSSPGLPDPRPRWRVPQARRLPLAGRRAQEGVQCAGGVGSGRPDRGGK